MLGASDKFKTHLRSSHSRRVRIGLYLPNELGEYEFNGHFGVVDGTLTIDNSRNIVRQAQMQVSTLESTIASAVTGDAARDFFEALTAKSAELEIEWGLIYPDLSEEWVTLARLRVDESVKAAVSGSLQVTAAYDPGTRIADFYLITPYAPFSIDNTKLTYLEAIQDLVNVAYPSTNPPEWIINEGVDGTSLPPDGTVFTGSRWDAIQALAVAINTRVAPDHLGRWTVQPVVDSHIPVWEVDAGDSGVLVSEETTFSRREQYNAVGVRWESPNSGGGIVYLVDSDPESPTYFDGPFGRKPRPEETVSTITTEAQALDAARSLLDKYKGQTRGIQLQTLHNPLMEPGDVIAVQLPDNTIERHIIDTLSIPLAGGVMSMQTRVVRSSGGTYDADGINYGSPAHTYDGHPTA
jgi:hypothetical protein